MSRRVHAVLFLLVFFVLTTGVVYAQDEAVEVQKRSLFNMIQAGGLIGYMIILLSVIGLALMIQYVVNINQQKMGNPALLSEAEALLTEGNIDEAFQLAQSDKSYAGALLTGALSRSYAGYAEAREGLAEAAAIESFKWNARISYVSLVGNIGPLLGLLGTVTGMIGAFTTIEQKASPTPADLAVGVYEALVTTVFGLLVAVMFLSGHFFLKNKLMDIMLRLNNEVGELLSRTISPEAQQAAGGK